MKNKTDLRHVILYAKAWYKYSGDIFADIKKCLTADGYSGEYFTNSDCMAVILHRYEDLVEGQTGRITDIIFEIRPSNCWKYGYITKDSPAFLTNNKEVVPDYNLDEAILRYCLSQFCNMEKMEWNIGRPDFKNCLPRRKGITNKQVDEMFRAVENKVK